MNNNSLVISACCPSPNSTTDKRQQHNTQTSVHLTDLSVLFVLEHYYSMSTTELSVATATHTKSRGGRQRRQHVHERTDPTAVVGATIWPEFPFPLHSIHGHNIGYSGPALPDRYTHTHTHTVYCTESMLCADTVCLSVGGAWNLALLFSLTHPCVSSVTRRRHQPPSPCTRAHNAKRSNYHHRTRPNPNSALGNIRSHSLARLFAVYIYLSICV